MPPTSHTGEPRTAEAFAARLAPHADPDRRAHLEQTFRCAPGDTFLGVRMGTVFDVAKEFVDLPPAEIDALLDSDVHELRVGALSVMAKQAARRSTSDGRRRELFELYLRRHDRIDSWDLVDLAAHHVVGRHLEDRPRDVLYELARSDDVWRRRTAIYSTLHFIRRGDVDDAFAIAELLLGDEHDLMQKITGGVLREAGKTEPERLAAFLDRHAATMPRPMLRTAIERLDAPARTRYLGARAELRRGRR